MGHFTEYGMGVLGRFCRLFLPKRGTHGNTRLGTSPTLHGRIERTVQQSVARLSSSSDHILVDGAERFQLESLQSGWDDGVNGDHFRRKFVVAANITLAGLLVDCHYCERKFGKDGNLTFT